MNRIVAVIFGIAFVWSSTALALPGATGNSPTGGATVGSSPTFTWTPVGGATWYRVWANPGGAGANRLFCTDPMYGAGRVDPEGCWVQARTTHVETKVLTPGNWKWFVHAWSPGSRGSDWSPGHDFIVSPTPPTPSFGMSRAAVHVNAGVAPIVSRFWNSLGGTPTVTRYTTGTYAVRFPGFNNMPISFWTGVVGAGNAASSNGYMTIQPLAGTSDGLYVRTYNASGAPAAKPFYIIVH
jgi:hypothetical protein